VAAATQHYEHRRRNPRTDAFGQLTAVNAPICGLASGDGNGPNRLISSRGPHGFTASRLCRIRDHETSARSPFSYGFRKALESTPLTSLAAVQPLGSAVFAYPTLQSFLERTSFAVGCLTFCPTIVL
jgi:hypothetical protein